MWSVLSALLCLACHCHGFSRWSALPSRLSLDASSTSTASSSLSNRILNGVKLKFPGNNDRVIDCFTKFSQGIEVDRLLGDGSSSHNRQKANCYVEGLTTMAFHDEKNPQKFPWVAKLEASSHVVAKELQEFILKDKLKKEDSSKWLGPRFEIAGGGHYGNDWKTLGLQDRGLWDGENVNEFPKTIELLKKCKVPSCEVFFARQGPNSGIQPHSDLNNFIITAHLAVDVPHNMSYIRVGDDIKYWENGKVIVFDTSIYHSTRNDGSSDRYVLLIRFWHPDLTVEEIDAFSFIFNYLDHASLGESALQQFEYEQLYGMKLPKQNKSPSESTDAERVKRKGSDKSKGFHRGV